MLVLLFLASCSSSSSTPTTQTNISQEEIIQQDKISQAINKLDIDANVDITQEQKELFLSFFETVSLGQYTPLKLANSTFDENSTYYQYLAIGTKGEPVKTVGKYSITLKKDKDGTVSLVNIIVHDEVELE